MREMLHIWEEIELRLTNEQIADPNERRRLALAEIDKAPFGWCMLHPS
jgi:hypothetical protein